MVGDKREVSIPSTGDLIYCEITYLSKINDSLIFVKMQSTAGCPFLTPAGVNTFKQIGFQSFQLTWE